MTPLRSPQRIVCLSADSADWLARLGAWPQVVGITAFYTPPASLAPKPRIGGFSTAKIAEIVALRPDLVLGFSDVQAELAASLLRAGLSVFVSNQRSLDEIHATLATIARLVDREAAAAPLLDEFHERLRPAARVGPRPRVYFEEWYDPPVTCIRWVSELIERAGGDDIFAGYRECRAARERQIEPDDVLAASPDVLIASWCGQPVDWDLVLERSGWSELPAIRAGRMHEIPSDDILQPGWQLVAGYEMLKRLLADDA